MAVAVAASSRRRCYSNFSPISRQFSPYRELLVGTETGDDAAVWQLDDRTCIIATTDFFMPIVDDPYEFGRIAATNAISDVYAMGGRPIFALALLGMPIAQFWPVEVIGRIVAGGEGDVRRGPASRSPAATRSTRSSRSTGSRSSASAVRRTFAATPAPRRATPSF